MIIKCKMCGGDLIVTEGKRICECAYCGSMQTVPFLDSEKKVTLFSRANRLRSIGEFDKAYSVYENIVADFPEEAEAYWGLVLCKYGIEYVDDPATGKKIPTCHRSSFDSVLEDSNFGMVMEYADAEARSIYREEAKAIERLRNGILEVSSKEQPYDIFICFKETDEKGDRTVDSVIAQDVYTALTEKGYRVFFSRITLEDKLGQEYEPYIFAALHSAKVMLAFGTSYDYYNAVWVKNEWSRFLALIAKGEKKVLIPCYKDIDAYDMPPEFKKLQAQDMGKVGAIQDLLRGIEKILGNRAGAEVASSVVSESPSKERFLTQAMMYMKTGEYEKADQYFRSFINDFPTDYRGWWGMVRAQTSDLTVVPVERNDIVNNYYRAMEYAPQKEKQEISKDFKEACSREVQHLQQQINDLQKSGSDAQSQLKQNETALSDLELTIRSLEQSIGKDRDQLGKLQRKMQGGEMDEFWSKLCGTLIFGILFYLAGRFFYSLIERNAKIPNIVWIVWVVIAVAPFVILIIRTIVSLIKDGIARSARREYSALDQKINDQTKQKQTANQRLTEIQKQNEDARNAIQRYSKQSSDLQAKKKWYAAIRYQDEAAE